MLQRLAETLSSYEFVSLPWERGLRYKQINVLWGEQNHGMICIVRADVAEMLHWNGGQRMSGKSANPG